MHSMSRHLPPLALGGEVSPWLLATISFLLLPMLAHPADAPLQVNLRSRPAPSGSSAAGLSSTPQIIEKKAAWDPKRTAMIVVDMWDDHWCKSAARRVAELAGPMNAVLKNARERGVFVIHAPSTVTSFYQNTPQRARARSAPLTKPAVPLSTAERWGTTWCWPDPAREKELPIDDSDMGCDCASRCVIRDAWTRQIATIEIGAEDAITDHGQETLNLLAQRGIENVILLGVHLNMCVLGRPFGIRQLVKQGRNVVLMRDMTDTMYNPEKSPRVDHFAGTELVVEHVEKFWCPTITSADFTGRPAFRFQADPRRAQPVERPTPTK
jgi:nicotinamidase-related amidase